MPNIPKSNPKRKNIETIKLVHPSTLKPLVKWATVSPNAVKRDNIETKSPNWMMSLSGLFECDTMESMARFIIFERVYDDVP